MRRSTRRVLLSGPALAAAALLAACAGTAGSGSTPGDAPASGPFSFFVSSTGLGKGADLGGLTGADQHCQNLAAAAGAGAKTWRAYLSTQGKDGQPTVNARDRIGKGPWFNAKGMLIARSIDELHSPANQVTKSRALDERGQVVSGRGDAVNRHDILTGSRVDGTAFSPYDPDLTCGNWTRGGSEGAVMVGHHDRVGPTADPWATSWNSSHQSRGGCSPAALKSTGGEGLLYCFAVQ
jgi:hypothetical protein